ncbi:MAG: hypothetical protein U1D96_07365 [Eubacteriales bacterium]|nr:hypothetical protein [Bacillota bacterium]MBV1726542.1 hypothetical protein [Desulforudis sp.]MDP3051442.1 hypothetical protein [Eubacteriales bacterium]MDQ7788607.1 hypothetical protein [Clostridia bacterium]MBU4532651.1 hypothetical protein [Bacillota bacterium]
MSEAKKAKVRQEEPLCTDENNLCVDCCGIFMDPALREAFGYQEELADCQCHDICVPDVRLICAEEITHVFSLPGVNGPAFGCRGGRVITEAFPATCESVTVRCAEEELNEDCDAVLNTIGLEIVLLLTVNGCETYLVINTDVEFECTTFFTFPDGLEVSGEDLTEALKFIDGSCKTIIIESCQVLNDANPRVEVELKVIDKLWKHENLLVSAVKPYPENITVSQLFERNLIGPCLLR